MKGGTSVIVFGGGCFWCTEAVFKMLRGVIGTQPGYAGGNTKDPTYERVSEGITGHAETLRVEYDPKRMPLGKLLEVFFEMHDPTSKDRQEGDVGSQYRSIILCTSEKQMEEVNAFIGKIRKNYGKPIVTEVKRLGGFHPAEDYHKDYYEKNPHQPYCLLVIGPKVAKIRKEFGDVVA